MKNQKATEKNPKQKAVITNIAANKEAKSTIKKGPTTIFPMRNVLKRKESAEKAAMAVKPTEEDAISSDDELLRAAKALEKVVTLSDE